MRLRELSIPDAYEITPRQFPDERGTFFEWYRFDMLADAVGHPLALRQANTSVSRRGVVRGIHFADVPPGQAKYVTATRGAVLDIVVDIRVGSPAFGTWEAVLLDELDRRAVYLPEGLGHAFVALTDDATVSYLVSNTYDPSAEHGINPLDPELAIDFTLPVDELVLSEKDTEAPGLLEAAAAGLLPRWDATQEHYDALRTAR